MIKSSDKEIIGKISRTHGDTYSVELFTWFRIRERCNDPKNKDYSRYGGRGISVCQRWNSSYKNFLADMGRRPSPKHSIDRYPDNNGNYEPGNCRWATSSQQAQNRSDTILLEFNGKTQPMVEWSRELGISYRTLQYRIRNGWPLEKALGPLTRSKRS